LQTSPNQSLPNLSTFPNVPTSTLNPVNSIDVQFSETINLNTFDKSDITLTRNGVTLTLPNTVTVEYLSDTTYRINGLGNLTNTPGIYNLKIDATTIQDNAGNSGDAAKTATFTITPPPTPGVTLTQTAGNTTVTEGGNTDTYSLVLKTQPTADVTITLTSNNQITLNSTSLTFTTTNWNTPQNLTITAVDDTLTEGNHTATITHNISSTDTNYNGLTIGTVNVSIQDNDAEIKGNIWNDIDGNAVNNSEPNLSGWTVYLDTNNNNQLDTGETTTQTDTNGNYSFSNLRPGTYTVAQIVQEGWQQTYPILNITTTAADIPLTIPTLDLISPLTTGQTQLNFNAANYTVKEDGTAITEIIINRTGDITSAVSATLSFIDGTAKGCGCAASSVNNDFNNVPFTITLAANETSKVIAVQNSILGNPNVIKIRNDSKVEGDEYFTLQLTNPTNGAIIGNQGTANVTILDDESPQNNPTNSIPTVDNTNANNLINLNDFWSDSRFSNIKGQGQSIVIIDTGADLNHPLFGADTNNNGIADKIIYQYDFADNDADASDKNNHGSHITSIASQIAPDANLIILKVFKDDGSGYFADLEEALQWVNTNANTYNVASVNLSLGDNQNWTTQASRYGIGDELAAIAGQNILIAAAAGNSFYTFNSTPGLAYPAADPNVISVGAVWADDFGSRSFSNGAVDYTTFEDAIASFSQRHPLLDVFAPGILITGANATGGTISMGGTSQATPFISAIATLSQQIAQTYLGREITLTEFRTLLDTTSNLIIDGDNEQDNVINTGISYPRINVLALAEGILNLSNISSGSNTGNTGNNSGNDPIYVPDNTVSLVHTITLTAGQILTDINFGNQLLPTNQAPIVSNISKTGNEDNILTFTLADFTSAFSDPDNNSLTKIQITSLPNNGVLKVSNTAIALDQEINATDLNNLVFTPNSNFNGNISFSWNGYDGTVYAANPATVNLTINSVNDAPTVENAIADQTATEDTPFSFQIPDNTFADIDTGDTLNYSATLANDNPLPNWLNFNQTNRTFSGTPTNNDVGNLSLKVTATDSVGESVSTSFAIAITNTNDAPTVENAIADQTATEDTPFSFQIPNNTFADIDTGDTLTYSATLSNGNPLPNWLNFNQTNRTFSGTPTNNDVGNLSLKVTVTDSVGESVSDSFSLTIVNDDTGVTSQLSINDITVVEGKDNHAILTVTVHNPNPQQITVNYTTTPIDATANVDYTSQTGTLTIAPNTSTATISIPILNDNLNEPDEVFTVTLSNPVNATINPDEAIGQVIISDTLQSAITRTLPNNVENLRLIGTNNINGTGNAGDNKITGNSGDNILAGANGNDIYCFNASTPLGSDTIQETTTGGIDTLDFTGTNTAVRVNLGVTTNQTVVTNNLKLTFSANNTIENIIGDSGNDRLTGNSLNNTLTGAGGNDQLTGQDGNDSLIGGSGDDLLTGGNGSDNFIFNSSNLGIDAISDFTPGSDKIVLSKAIFPALQSSIGNGFSQPAEFASVADDDLVATSSAFIVYSTSSGSIYYNQNGSAAGLGSGSEFANLLTVPTLIAADFALIN